MKKTVSAFLIATFVLSGALTSFGQAKRVKPVGPLSVPADSVNTPVRPPAIVPAATTEGDFVQFAHIDAVSDGVGTFIRWRMAFETNNRGFGVYRVGSGQYELVNTSEVLGGAIRNSRQPTVTDEEYELFDPQGSLNTIYVIRANAIDGSTLDSNTFVPRQVRNIEAEVMRTRESLIASALHLNSSVASRSLELPQDLRDIVNENIIEPDLPTQQWVAAQPGVKISVVQDGLHRITRQQLITGGFDVSGDSANWRLFMNGIEQAIIVGAGGQYIEFMGRSLDVRESGTRIYYLISGDVAGKRMTTKVLRPIGGTVVSPNYRATAKKKERVQYLADVINGETENYFGNLVANTPVTNVPFTVTGIDASVSRVVLSVKVQGYSGVRHSIRVQLNGHDVGSLAGGFGKVALSEDFLVPPEFFIEGENVLSLNESASGQNSFFDTVSVRYSRKYQADQNSISFYTPGLRKVDVKGFTTSDIRLFDTTLDANPVQIIDLNVVQEGNTFTVKLPSSRAMVAYGVTEASLLTSPSITPNVPSTLSSTTNGADLIIITEDSVGFIAAAETWADYRRSRTGGQVTVKVANVLDVYDEYGYGVHTASAINGFLKAAKESWSTPPRYVLLIGDASFDPRNYQGLGDLDRVPTNMVTLIYEESGSDEALADFNHDGVADIPIGRIPARTTPEIATVLNKTMAFENPGLQSLDRGALLANDVLSQGFDFYSMSLALAAELPASMPKQFISRGLPPPNQGIPDPQAQANLLTGLNQGKYIVNYAGHGAAGVWASINFFGNSNVPLLTNANTQSIFTMLTCFNGRFYDPTRESLGEVLLESSNGGAVAAWASTTETTPDYQLFMGSRFYNQIGVGDIKRIGDLIRDAKLTIAGSDVGYSWALLGDPMLQVRAGVAP